MATSSGVAGDEHERGAAAREQTLDLRTAPPPPSSCSSSATRVEWAMAFGLLPFAFTGLVDPSAWIGYVVLVNGLVFHGGAALRWRWAWLARLVDITCNVALCVYVNASTHWQPGTALLSLVSLVAWLVSRRWREDVSQAVVHIVLVQWVQCYLLYVFESGR